MYEVCVRRALCDISSRRICGTQVLTPLYSVKMGERAPPRGQIQVSSKRNVHVSDYGRKERGKIKEETVHILPL